MPLFGRRWVLCEGSTPLAPGEVFGRTEDAFFHMRFGIDGIRIAYAAGAQILVQPSFAKASADE